MGLFTKLFGTRSEREVKKLEPQVEAVMALEEPYKKLTDQQLREKTQEFKDRLATGETLDDLLPEAFAVCREAASRVLGMRPYRVQVVGGIVLHQGRIAEMKTGEGKTLVAILPAYLNALTGNGVHIVTVNDYLAKRDSEWMGKVYRFLGLSVGLIIHDLTAEQRRAAYAADITYGTNNELGFDYLRDNMAIYKQEMVQRGHAFAIVDEVDSILIDEARTPLIISGKGEESSKLYEMADFFVSRLKKQVFSTTDDKELQDQFDCDYIVDEKERTVSLTQKGIAKAATAAVSEAQARINLAFAQYLLNHGECKDIAALLMTPLGDGKGDGSLYIGDDDAHFEDKTAGKVGGWIFWVDESKKLETVNEDTRVGLLEDPDGNKIDISETGLYLRIPQCNSSNKDEK